jgi:hypothetical protein
MTYPGAPNSVLDSTTLREPSPRLHAAEAHAEPAPIAPPASPQSDAKPRPFNCSDPYLNRLMAMLTR